MDLTFDSFNTLTPADFDIIRNTGLDADGNQTFTSERVSFAVLPTPNIPFQNNFIYAGADKSLDPLSTVDTPYGDDIAYKFDGGSQYFGVKLSGYLYLPQGGTVTFNTVVDDIVKLVVNGRTLLRVPIDNTNRFDGGVIAEGLPKGFVPIEIVFSQLPYSLAFQVMASGGGLPGGILDSQYLFPTLPEVNDGDEIEYTPLAGEFSSILKKSDGRFVRIYKNGNKDFFNSDGLLVEKRDLNSNSIFYNYLDGKISKISDSAGNETIFNYTSGKISGIFHPGGGQTTLIHDDLGDLVEIIDPDGTSRKFKYAEKHLLTEQTTKRGKKILYSFDEFGRNTYVKRADGSERFFNPSSTKGAVSHNEGSGDKDNPVAVLIPGSDAGEMIDGRGHTSKSEVDDFGSPIKEIDALGRVFETKRDINSQITEVIDKNGNKTLITYDENGNRTSIRNIALNELYQFEYANDFNKISKSIDPLGNVTTFDYDTRGNLIKIIDAKGNATTFEYDDRGLLTKQTDPLGRSFTYGYDTNGNKVLEVDPLGNSTSFEYDARGNLVRVVDAKGFITSFEYDLLNRQTKKISARGFVTSFSYDERGNLSQVIDANDNRTSFEYDNWNRLIKRVDPLGNRSSGTRVGVGNQLLEDENNFYQYDDLGNITNIESKTDNSSEKYSWDEESKLRTLEVFDKDNNLVSKTEYLYDFKGRRIQKRVNGVSEKYIYSNDMILMDLTSSNEINSRYVFSDKIDDMQFMERDANKYFYYQDGLGSIVDLSDEKGQVQESYSYTSFGKMKVFNSSGAEVDKSQVENRYTFTGREFEEESGVYFYRARYYNPQTGRFM